MEEKNANTKKSLTELLRENGFVLPTTEENLLEYQENFGTTNIILPEDIDKPDFLFEELPQSAITKIRKKSSNNAKVIQLGKPTNIDYYRRIVLAAEIVFELHTEMAFGHLKLQKLIYLSLKVENISLPVNFLKQAMGPYDNQLMRSIDKQLKLKKWFEFHPTEKLKYKPLEKVGQHKTDFEKYFGNQKEKIYWLIETFRKIKSPTIEIVATLFACWEEINKDNETLTDDLLLAKFYKWSDYKQKYSENEVLTQKAWMIENSLVPVL